MIIIIIIFIIIIIIIRATDVIIKTLHTLQID